MTHHPIFETFQRKKCTATGQHIFDFLGVATDVRYKAGWSQHAVKNGSPISPPYPMVNEHYFDWIAMLKCVRNASGVFRMAELGAGYAPWLVRAVFAARQTGDVERFELVGVEADATHFEWTLEHFRDNGLSPSDYHLLHGAVSPEPALLRFPKIPNPDEDYGASVKRVQPNTLDYVEVQGYTLDDLLSRFSGPVDFVHIDIQGSEYDVIPQGMELLKTNVKAIMVGTHLSQEQHLQMYQLFNEQGWIEQMVFPRNEEVTTEFGVVKFGDGFQYWRNPRMA